MTTDSLTPEARETLKALAEKATPGPWHASYGTWPTIYQTHHVTRDVWHVASLGDHYGMLTGSKVDEDAAYIAAAHPAAILALLSALDEADKCIEHLEVSGIHSCHERCQRVTCVLRRERDAMEAERDRLAADNARMRDALEVIAEYGECGKSCPWSQAMAMRAREALDKHADDDAAGGGLK